MQRVRIGIRSSQVDQFSCQSLHPRTSQLLLCQFCFDLADPQPPHRTLQTTLCLYLCLYFWLYFHISCRRGKQQFLLLLFCILLGCLVLIRWMVELFDDAVAILFMFPCKNSLVFVVQIYEMLPQVVSKVLLLQIFLRILIIHLFHLMIQGLKFLPDASDLLLYRVQLLLALIVGPARVRVSLLDDATQLRSAESGYYGLIHYERKREQQYKLPIQEQAIIFEQQNQLEVDAEANQPSTFYFFYFKRCYSPRRLGSSTFGYLSFSPFFGRLKWFGVRDRMAGFEGTNLEASSFLLQVKTVPYFLSMNESQLSFVLLAQTVVSIHFLNFKCSQYALPFSLNSKYSSLFQNSQGLNLYTFLLFIGTFS